MKHFVKYENWWWEYDPNLPKNNMTLYNNVGGRNSMVDITGLETAVAESLADLDWQGTEAYDKKYKTGWLAPNGKFFGCDNGHHLANAKYVQHKSERQLENEGYIKIVYSFSHGKYNKKIYEAIFIAEDYNVYPTDEQIMYIKSHYKGNDGENMVRYLLRCKMMRREQIKKEWGMER